MILHLPAPADQPAGLGVTRPVEGPAPDAGRLEHGDAISRHLPVPDQERGTGERSEPAAHEVGRLLIHSRWFPGPGESLVVALGVVHRSTFPVLADSSATRAL